MWAFEHRERYKPDGRRYASDLSDAEWAAIAPLFSTYRPVLHDIREIVNGCFYLAAEGCRWRSGPKEFGPWQTNLAPGRRCVAIGIGSSVMASGPKRRPG